MKKIMVLAVAVAMAFVTSARPHGGFGGFRPGPMHHGGFHHGHGGFWGRGGRNFWPEFAGGVVGGMVGGYCYGGTTVVAPAAVTAAPYTYYPLDTVVRPVEAYQQVWVPGALVPVTRPDGTVTYVRQPGHYERVRVQ